MPPAVPDTRSFYRIIADSVPGIDDFRSHAELGLPPLRELTPGQRHRWGGVSMFDSIENAKAHHARSRRLGTHVAEVRLTDRGRYDAERTGRAAGHWTVWAQAEFLLASVVAIIPVDE